LRVLTLDDVQCRRQTERHCTGPASGIRFNSINLLLLNKEKHQPLLAVCESTNHYLIGIAGRVANVSCQENVSIAFCLHLKDFRCVIIRRHPHTVVIIVVETINMEYPSYGNVKKNKTDIMPMSRATTTWC